jgi:periplasmic divalent cation tolerance protein
VTNKLVVLVTCGSRKEAQRLARAIVDARLAACVNLITAPVESVYRWKRRVERAKEFLLLIKTTRRQFEELRREIERRHSYDTPEIIALPIDAGSRDYLDWIDDSLSDPAKKHAKRRSRKS